MSASVPLYKQHPDQYAYNSTTKRHMLKSSPAFKKRFAENPDQFVETALMFSVTVPTVPAPRAPEPAPAPPVIGDPLPKPESLLTHEEIEKNVSKQMQDRVRSIVDSELKSNPEPYEGKKSPELEELLRAFIIQKLDSKKKPDKKKAAPKSKFTLRPVPPPNSDSSESDPDSSD